MKKLVSVMLAAILLLTANVCIGAEETDSKVNFSLQCDGKNTVTVKAGTEIRVDLLLKNEEPYKVFTVTDEIEFDETFFDYIGEITPKTDKVDGEKQSYTDGVGVIKIIGSYTTPKTYEAEQHIVSFKLKVKDTATGYGMVKSDPETVMVCGSSNYEVKNTDLTVIIGDETSEKRVLTFETNGGEMSTKSVVKNKGETVDLSSYTPSRSGYKFKGWHKDSGLSQSVTSVTLKENMTVYAKWEKENSDNGGNGGGGGGGGVAVTTYKLTFETNGGTEIKTVSKEKNTIVDLSKYTTTKDGCTLEGWYSDKDLTEKVTEIKMTENTTVYAKWNENNETLTSGTKDIFGNVHPTHISYINGYPDGSVNPDGEITREEVTAILYRITSHEYESPFAASGDVFPDVTTDMWSAHDIEYMADKNIVSGYPDGEFKPTNNLTRAEFATLICRFAKLDSTDGENPFSDLSNTHWAYDSILSLAKSGLVEGYEDGSFRPESEITRAEVMTVVNKILGRNPSDSYVKSLNFNPYTDLAKDEWYYTIVIEATVTHDYSLNKDGVEEKWENWK